jgi:hypothetical protein
MKRTKLLLGILVGIILSLVVTQVVASNRISTAGIELSLLQTDLKEIKRENSLLKEKILTLSSLTLLASRAGELGFVEGKQAIYINAPLPLARN